MKRLFICLIVLSLSVPVFALDAYTESLIRDVNAATARNNRLSNRVEFMGEIVGFGIIAGLSVWGYRQNTAFGRVAGTYFGIKAISIIF